MFFAKKMFTLISIASIAQLTSLTAIGASPSVIEMRYPPLQHVQHQYPTQDEASDQRIARIEKVLSDIRRQNDEQNARMDNLSNRISELQKQNDRIDNLSHRVSELREQIQILAARVQQEKGVPSAPPTKRIQHKLKFDQTQVTQYDIEAIWRQIDEILLTLDQITH